MKFYLDGNEITKEAALTYITQDMIDESYNDWLEDTNISIDFFVGKMLHIDFAEN